MNEVALGPLLIFGIVLAPVYLMLAGWFARRPRDWRLPLVGVGFLAGFTALAWGGMALLGVLLDLVYF